ncbi:hypothetical protein LTR94_024434, partial [Friedmanniomyces endolithicus]
MNGIKSQDIVVLLKLASLERERAKARISNIAWPSGDPYAVRSLETQLGISKTEVNAAIKRSLALGLAVRDREDKRPRPNNRALEDFLFHGLKFIFPAAPGAMTRGIPTAFGAPMLKGLLLSGGEYIYVWPDAAGTAKGQG